MSDFLKDVIAPLGAALSALFAGLIWWLARKRLASRYTLVLRGKPISNALALGIEILNRSDKDIVIEAVSVKAPLFLLANKEEALFGEGAPKGSLEDAKRILRASDSIRRIEPDKTQAWSVVVGRDGGFQSCKTVSIALHILRSFPTIRHKKKVLTTILPPKMRSDTSST